jgi:hypothetical protein
VTFDPRDIRHIAVGYTHGGAISVDGGFTWQLSDTAGANVFTLAFAPSDRNVLWMEGLVPPGAETVYRSTDGGLSYGVILTESQNLCDPIRALREYTGRDLPDDAVSHHS